MLEIWGRSDWEFFFFSFSTNRVLSYPDIQAARTDTPSTIENMGRPTKDSKSVVPKRPKSLVWKQFGDNLNGQHAHCTLYKEKGKAESIKINDFSTQPLCNYLESFHKSEWRDIKAKEVKIEADKAPEKKAVESR